jgi:hypothetical protein
MNSTVRRVGAAGLVLGLCLGAASTLPAHADSAPAPVGGALLGAVDGGLLGGLVGGLLQGQGGVFGPDGGVLAGDDQVGDVVSGLAGDGGLLGGLSALSAVGDSLANPQIGGDGSFGDPQVGGGPAGGVVGGLLGGLLGGGAGLLGGVF